MKTKFQFLMLVWGALLAAIAADSYGPHRGAWFESIGLGFVPSIWRSVADQVTAHVWAGPAFFVFWLVSSFILFHPRLLGRLFVQNRIARA